MGSFRKSVLSAGKWDDNSPSPGSIEAFYISKDAAWQGGRDKKGKHRQPAIRGMLFERYTVYR